MPATTVGKVAMFNAIVQLKALPSATTVEREVIWRVTAHLRKVTTIHVVVAAVVVAVVQMIGPATTVVKLATYLMIAQMRGNHAVVAIATSKFFFFNQGYTLYKLTVNIIASRIT